MIAFQEKSRYVIMRADGPEGWLTTIRSLLSVLGNQDPQTPLDPFELQQVCRLICDMLPDEDQIVHLAQAWPRAG